MSIIKCGATQGQPFLAPNPCYPPHMSRFFFALMIVAMFLTLASLVVGLAGMIKGGEFNKKYGNRLMRLRVTMQGLALGFFILAVLTAGSE